MERPEFPFAPMEAETVDDLPAGGDWQYEPKWDGFRCVAFKEPEGVRLQSKAGQPLERYFPEVVARVSRLPGKRFVLDGELVVPVDGLLSFDDLLQRIHPAESRIRRLAGERAAWLVAFDLLADSRKVWGSRPLRERRPALEAFLDGALGEGLALSPATTSMQQARAWLQAAGAGLDGVMAKRLDAPYVPGERSAMVKVKLMRTADCVVGGFRYASSGRGVGSLLLGLYAEDGLLHHVGFTSGIKAAERPALTERLEGLSGAGFTGRAPGGPSRWNRGRSAEWQPLRPELVVEVEYDHFSQGRFRHGARLVRWRPDKAPAQCTFEQVARRGSSAAPHKGLFGTFRCS